VLTICLDDIRDEGLLLTGEVDDDLRAELVARINDLNIEFTGPIDYTLRVVRAYDMVEVDATIAAQVELPCGRCLKRFVAPLSESFSLTFATELPEVEDESGEEGVELTAEEMGIDLVEGDELDLAEPLLENILIAMPLHPLCNGNCQGLCPNCGIDRNAGTCQCAQPQFDTRFAALKNLKLDPNGSKKDS
jgi:uncharacterized protein